ncbi:MAG: carboxypeptidase [Bdellovibrionales bacterium]|nr:carboxypeptidase [Bdellovibrionales bacterium]
MYRYSSLGLAAAVFFVSISGYAAKELNSFQAKTDRKYPEVIKYLETLESSFPGTCKRVVIGKSDSGVNIEGIRIGSGPVKAMIVAAHHGNEYGSTEVALAAATEFSARPMPNHTVFVIPVLNIGGYNSRNREEKSPAGSHDPNRDYPGPCGSDSEFALKSTRALAEFMDREGVVSSATLHTYYPAVVYPWGFATHDLTTEYQKEFEDLVRAGASESRYETGNSTNVIYPANGTFEDYAFWKSGVWSLLYELGFSHYPSVSQIEEMVRVNVPGLRAQMEIAPKTRASKHAFTGRCDDGLRLLDRRDE